MCCCYCCYAISDTTFAGAGSTTTAAATTFITASVIMTSLPVPVILCVTGSQHCAYCVLCCRTDCGSCLVSGLPLHGLDVMLSGFFFFYPCEAVWTRIAKDRESWRTLAEGYFLQWKDTALNRIELSNICNQSCLSGCVGCKEI